MGLRRKDSDVGGALLGRPMSAGLGEGEGCGGHTGLVLLSFSFSVASDHEFRAGVWPSAAHKAAYLAHSSGTS